MHLRVDPHDHVPPSQQLVNAVLDAVAAGELGPGDRLPPLRSVAAEALVNPNTVSRAWRDLEQLGVTAGRNGSGVFVTEDGPRIARQRRRTETLAQLAAAIAAARQAGIDDQTLFDECHRLLGFVPLGGRT